MNENDCYYFEKKKYFEFLFILPIVAFIIGIFLYLLFQVLDDEVVVEK